MTTAAAPPLSLHRDRLIPRSELAVILGLKEQTLALWACRGKGPKVTRVGNRNIRYRMSDVEAWIEANNTSDDND